MFIIMERYRRLQRHLKPRHTEYMRDKAQRYQMTLSAVIKEYHAVFLPKRLHKLAASCFTADSLELHEAEAAELRSRLRYHERAAEKEKLRRAKKKA